MCASTATVEPGTVVLLGIGVGPMRVRVPCRVIYAVAEPQQKGFAYGTLPGHLESGEEAFTINQRDDGLVVFTIAAFSRPTTTAARAAGPLGLLIPAALHPGLPKGPGTRPRWFVIREPTGMEPKP